VSTFNVIILSKGSESFTYPLWVEMCSFMYNKKECYTYVKKLADLVALSLLGYDMRPEFFCEEIIKGACSTDYYKPLNYKTY
jgi:hypothetical protein